MVTRATELATQCEATNDALIEAVQGCSEAGWRKRSASEGWLVGVLAHHVAISYGPIAAMVRTVAQGQELPPMSLQTQAANNAKHAQDYANVDKEETLDALRRNGAAAAEVVRGLDGEQLGRTTTAFGGREMTAAQLIEGAVIGHPKQHLESIRAALAS